MTIPSTPRKAGPLLGNGVTTTWPFAFKVFSTDDVKVTIADADGVETEITSNYTVELNANQETSPGGTVTYPVSGDELPTGSVLTITGDLDYDQPLDLPSGGNFSPLALENQLDRAGMQIQQLREELDRAARLPVTSAEDAESLVADIVRIADSADNLDTVAGSIGSVNTVAADIADVNTVAGSIASVNTTATNIAAVVAVGNDLLEPESEIDTVATSIANVNAVGDNIAGVNTVAGISADVSTVAGIAADVTAVADIAGEVTNFADVYQGAKATDPTLRNDGSALQAGDLYFNTTENALRAYSGTLWVAGTSGTISVTTFSGDGVETEFALPTAPASENNTQVYIDGVYQQKDQYSVAGPDITFSAAPPAGTDNIEVVTIATLALGETDAVLVSYSTSGGTVEDALDERLPEIGTYALLRLYSGSYTSYYVRGVASIFDGGGGVFRVDSADTTSTDNGGTILVDAAGRRWKREFTGSLNVLWFGADRSGVADSTTAIQAALTLAATSVLSILAAKVDAVTAAVFAPAGSYKTSATLMVGEGTEFFGESSSTSLIRPTHTGVAIQMGGPDREYSQVKLRKLGIIGNRSGTLSYGAWTTTTSIGVYVEDCIRECSIEDCWITQCQASIKAENSYAFEVNRNYLVYALDYHIESDNAVNWTIAGNRIDWSEKHGIYLNGTNAGDETLAVNITGNAIQICWRNAVWLYDCASANVSGNFFESNYREAVDATTHVYADVNIETGPNSRGYSFTVNNNFFTHGSSPTVDAYTAIRCNKASGGLVAMGNVCRDSSYWRLIDAGDAAVERLVVLGNAYAGTFTKVVYNTACSGLIEEQDEAGSITMKEVRLGGLQIIPTTSSSNVTSSDKISGALISTAGGNRQFFLRDVDCVAGRMYFIKKTTGDTNNLVVTREGGSTKTIDGATSVIDGTAYAKVRVISDGSNWFTV